MPAGGLISPTPPTGTTTTTTSTTTTTRRRSDGAFRRSISLHDEDHVDIVLHDQLFDQPSSSSPGDRSVLPPLPHERSGQRSSSPRNHSFTSTSAAAASRRVRANATPNSQQQQQQQISSSSSSAFNNRQASSPSASSSSIRRQHQQQQQSLASASLRPSPRLSDLDPPPAAWGDDFFDLSPQVEALDEQYLSLFADNDFSSPSSYPSFTNPPPHPSLSRQQQRQQRQQRRSQASASATATSTQTASSTASHGNSQSASSTSTSRVPGFISASSSRSNTQLTLSSITSFDSQDTPQTTQLFIDEDVIEETPSSSFSESAMPTTRKRNAGTAAANPHATPTSKRRRTSRTTAATITTTTSPQQQRTGHQLRPSAGDLAKDFSDIFGDSPERALDDGGLKHEDLTTIDLTEANEVPEELRKPVEDNRIKLAAFQCAICMDDVTALTVTHCGHLYCAQCLHMSLHVDSTRGKCPMCRAKIDMKPRESYNSKTKGFWPLELKLMTATRKGKQKADMS